MTHASPRKRAPSARSLATRARIFDAAERLFAERGYDGASLRDIAAAADTTAGLVGFHGGAKHDLFRAVIARRAQELGDLRLGLLAARPGADLRAVLDACLSPVVDKALHGGPQWRAYARLMAIVSADPRWRAIAEAHFDPVANRFVDAIAALHPHAPRAAAAEGYVYAISACLAACTAGWRAEALSGARSAADMQGLLDFCEGGLRLALRADPGRAAAGDCGPDAGDP